MLIEHNNSIEMMKHTEKKKIACGFLRIRSANVHLHY